MWLPNGGVVASRRCISGACWHLLSSARDVTSPTVFYREVRGAIVNWI